MSTTSSTYRSTDTISQQSTFTFSQSQQPTSTVSQLQQPTSTVSQLEEPTSTVSQLQQSTSTVSQLQQPTSTVSQLQQPVSQTFITTSLIRSINTCKYMLLLTCNLYHFYRHNTRYLLIAISYQYSTYY